MMWTAFLFTLAGFARTVAHFSDNIGPDTELIERQTQAPPLEVEPVMVSGPITNRADLVFFSDGYLPEERAKFFEDARALAEGIAVNQSFNSVQPLLNFWAAFTPSEESGIGVGGVPRNTAFGLYRDGTELRGVYTSRASVGRAACSSLGDQCDYPILLGNDPLYGGLGGQFTIITASPANGHLILRHELGHSIIRVGEEYDGSRSGGYFGVNAFHNLSQPIPWAHWMTSPPAPGEQPRVERWMMPMLIYAWDLLNTTTPWSYSWTSSGLYSRHVVRVSLSGLPEASDARLELDGIDLNWEPYEGIGMDRSFYDIFREGGLSDGPHELRLTLLNPEREGFAQMCSVEIMEFGNEEEFIATPGYYGLFPTYSNTNTTSYRPTNEDCLMRMSSTSDFCSVCLEGLWLSLLNQVSLIDGITEECISGNTTLSLSLVSLAELRNVPINREESWTIIWAKDGLVLEEFTNSTVVSIDGAAAVGSYAVDVKFTTEQIRVDTEGLTSDQRVHQVSDACVL